MDGAGWYDVRRGDRDDRLVCRRCGAHPRRRLLAPGRVAARVARDRLAAVLDADTVAFQRNSTR
jgi:hypothetical protein